MKRGTWAAALALSAGVICIASGAVEAFGNDRGRSTAFAPLSAGLPSLGLRFSKEGAASCLALSMKSRSSGIKMDRKDGGSKRIGNPGKGGGVGNPGAAPGGGGDGAGERERGGAGVAVLTKPPDLDKVSGRRDSRTVP